jgi:general secretion pathway protein D
MLFPGLDNQTPEKAPRDPGRETRVASAERGANVQGSGIEMNFEGADIQTVAKTLLGDMLGLNFVIDPRVQGTVTFASVGSIPRSDILPVFESMLRMSNAAVVREGNLVKIVPLPEASGNGNLSSGPGTPGFGVSVVALRYTSAATVAKTAESFLSRPGAVRVDQARNLLLVQGTTSERQAALDVVASFDVEWLRNQSVGVYPLKSTAPEIIIRELEKVFDTGEEGRGQGVVRFQPISRMNAVMVVTRNPKLLERATQWVQRLDRSDSTGTTVRVYRLKYGSAARIVKILNEIFVGQRAAAGDTPASQIAPGVQSAQSRLDASSGNGTQDRGATASAGNSSTTSTSSSRMRGPVAAAFESFADHKPGDENSPLSASGGSIPRGVFQNVRITADAGANAIVVYSNQEDYRVIERSLHELDRPQLQVAIDATVAEVTLTDALQFGVQNFLTSGDFHLGRDGGSVGLMPAPAAAATAAQTAVQAAFLQRVLPGFNLLLGPEAQPRLILNALSTLTEVKVLSAPSVVVVDSQPALLQVGDEIPISTGTATILSNSNTPVVNTIEMRNTGVILKVWPHVHANGAIQLEVEQEISNVVNPSQQTLTPTISQRRVHSTVAVMSGQTVLLGGLISEQEQKTVTGIPGLRQIKYLGDLFGARDQSMQRSEIIIFIRPKVIRDSVDARGVAEEFRDRLELMRSSNAIGNGGQSSAPANFPRQK